MRLKKIYFILFLLFIYLGQAEAETFIYHLKWIGIKAGTASLSFYEARDLVKVVSEARSDPWVDIFYKVRDRVESIIQKSPPISKRYRKRLREGKHQRDREVVFYPEPGKVLFKDYLSKEEKTIKVPPGLVDPLGGFYILRNRTLQIGKDEYLRIFDSKKVYDVRVEVLRKQTIETALGRFKTIVVRPHLKSEGIFYHKGQIDIYLTDDERHMPVLLKSKILIGSVVAELVKVIE